LPAECWHMRHPSLLRLIARKPETCPISLTPHPSVLDRDRSALGGSLLFADFFIFSIACPLPCLYTHFFCDFPTRHGKANLESRPCPFVIKWQDYPRTWTPFPHRKTERRLYPSDERSWKGNKRSHALLLLRVTSSVTHLLKPHPPFLSSYKLFPLFFPSPNCYTNSQIRRNSSLNFNLENGTER
jgi:hypothetical protein